jgi:Immunity protein Imm1
MGTSILYQPPAGPRIRNARIEVILSDVRDRDEAYWNQGNCHAAVHLGTNLSFDPCLTILFKDGYGFHITTRETHDEVTESFIASGCDDYEDVVRVWVGQNYLRLPRAFFVSRERAVQVVSTFCTTGKRDPTVTWLPDNDLDWTFYEPN